MTSQSMSEDTRAAIAKLDAEQIKTYEWWRRTEHLRQRRVRVAEHLADEALGEDLVEKTRQRVRELKEGYVSELAELDAKIAAHAAKRPVEEAAQ